MSKSGIFISLILASVIIYITGIALISNKIIPIDSKHEYDEIKTSFNLISENSSNDKTIFNYDNILDDDEKYIYDYLIKAYRHRKSEITIDRKISEDRFSKINLAIQYDHPELFYISNKYTLYLNSNETTINLYYYFDMKEEQKYKKQLDNKCKSIIEEANQLESDYDKIKYVYDYLVDNITYTSYEDKFDQTIIGGLLKGKCVCGGYAQSMSYLLKQLNIDCIGIYGKINHDVDYLRDSSNHVLNLVKSDNKYYYFDATWGDINHKFVNRTPLLRYKTFAMTSSQLHNYFNEEYEVELENSNSLALNYYVRNDCYFDSVDENKLQILIDKAKRNNDFMLIFQCSDKSIYNNMMSLLLNNKYYRNQFPAKCVYWKIEENLLFCIIENNY